MDDDRAAADGRGWFSSLGSAGLIIVDNLTRSPVPDLDAEFVHVPAPTDLTIGHCQKEAIVAASVDRSCSFELRLRARDHEPVIGGTAETQVACLELEFGTSAGEGSTLLVARDETEMGFTRQFWIGGAGSRR